MKRIAIAAVSAFLFAGAAHATNPQSVNINGTVGKKCGISAQSTSFTLANDLTDDSAKVRAAVTDEIATGLNAANIVGFCNVGNSQVLVERSVLALNGDYSSTQQLGAGGFARFIRYNLDSSIGGTALDSTSTAGGTTVAQPFGGHISLSDPNTHIQFQTASSQGAAVASSAGSSPTAVNWSSLTDRRLLAGSYTGTVTVTLTPGA
jgi:hypothetical protein